MLTAGLVIAFVALVLNAEDSAKQGENFEFLLSVIGLTAVASAISRLNP